MDPIQPSTQEPLQTPVQIPDFQPKPNYLKTIIFSVLTLITLGLIAYLIFQNQKLQKQVLNPPVSPTIQTPSLTPRPVFSISIPPDEMANWKKYEEPKSLYKFSYPNNWVLKTETSPDGRTWVYLSYFESKKEYAFAIVHAGIGIGGDRNSEVKDQEIYIDGKIFIRRSVYKNNKLIFISIIPKDINFNIFNHISMNFPNINIDKYLKIFDQILSTFKFTN